MARSPFRYELAAVIMSVPVIIPKEPEKEKPADRVRPLVEIKRFLVVLFLYAEVVEPGRHARLRGVWGNPCGFKSRLRHHNSPNGSTSPLKAYGALLREEARSKSYEP